MRILRVLTQMFPVSRYIDQGRNPQLYTKECLERALAKNEQVKGKIDTMKVSEAPGAGAGRWRPESRPCRARSGPRLRRPRPRVVKRQRFHSVAQLGLVGASRPVKSR